MPYRKTVVVIPTYNEVENIDRLLTIIQSMDFGLHVLFVDDNSPDGTAEKIIEWKNRGNEDWIYLIQRSGKLGLGTAYVTGFKWALKHGYERILEMDADLSHNPCDIPNFLKAAETADLVLGSRYKQGVNVVNWPLTRLLLSYGASLYTRTITGMPIKDPTGGFKCFRKEVLEALNLDEVKSNGYSFQIELTFKAWRKKFKIEEIPIIFIDRTVGKSKMSKAIVKEAILMVWRLRWLSIIGKI
ncbi:MAG: polyprenol monophosphomannose synthase [bacterium]|nr:polyprenol monophosphomannose synthase [bacterium]